MKLLRGISPVVSLMSPLVLAAAACSPESLRPGGTNVLDAGSNPGAGGSGAGGTGGAGGRGGSRGGGTGGQDAAPADSACLERFNLQKGPPPDVVIVLDRSGSMTQVPKTGTGNLWVQTTAALRSAVMLTQADINWGLGFFPGDVDCAVLPVEVPVAPGNFPAIDKAISAKNPGGNTPTTKGVEEAVAYAKTLTGPERKYLLLATDGAPNCAGTCMCEPDYMPMGTRCVKSCGMGCTSSKNCTLDDANGAVASVEAAAAAGLHTFVVGLASNPTFETTLDRMAIAGKEARMTTPRYYPVSDQADLESAMMAIARHIISCEFPLSKPPARPEATTVFMQGQMVPRDEMKMEGWDFGPGNMSIILYGSWCDKVKAGGGDTVEARLGCGTV